jgi:hypothetical protein
MKSLVTRARPAPRAPFRSVALAIGLAAASAPATASAYTNIIGPLVSGIGGKVQNLYSTDLGFSLETGVNTSNPRIRFLFGDSWGANDGSALATMALHDDVVGDIQLTTHGGITGYPTTDALLTYATSNNPTTVWGRKTAPLLYTQASSQITPIKVKVLSGSTWVDVSMEAGKTPTAAWVSPAEGSFPEQNFAVFTRAEPATCTQDSDCGSGSGLTCDKTMGLETITNYLTGGSLSHACVPGFGVTDDYGYAHPFCQPIAGGGLCRDTKSPMIGTPASPTYFDKVLSIASVNYVGVQDATDPTTYWAKKWISHKFFNVSARTVNSWDESVAPSDPGIYWTAANSAGTNYGKVVFVWGRPNFLGQKLKGSSGRYPRAYLAYVPLTHADAAHNFAWAPRFLTSIPTNLEPTWGNAESGTTPAFAIDANTYASESDVINQFDVVYSAAMRNWYTVYGGDTPDVLAQVALGSTAITRDPDGCLYARSAYIDSTYVGRAPWKWNTAKSAVLCAGNNSPTYNNTVSSDQYTAGNVLHHPMCTGASCVPADPGTTNLESAVHTVLGQSHAGDSLGRMYGAHFIYGWSDMWSSDNTRMWLAMTVSGWNPYSTWVIRWDANHP